MSWLDHGVQELLANEPLQTALVGPFCHAPCMGRGLLRGLTSRKASMLALREAKPGGVPGRLANGYFINGYFEFQCAEETHNFQRIGMSPVLSEGSSLFPLLLFLSGGPLGTFHGFSKYPFAKYPFASP